MSSEDFEDGEIEDGEIDDGPAEGSGELKEDEEGAIPASPSRETSRHVSSSHERSHRDGYRGGSRERSVDRSRKEEDRPRTDDDEKEEVIEILKEYTRFVSVQDVMRSLETVCKDIKIAIKKLDKLCRLLKKQRTDEVEQFPDAFFFSKRVYEALKAVHIVSNTGQGRTQNLETARTLMRTALNYRHDVLTGAQKRDLEQWVKGSNVFRVILDERDKDLLEQTKASASPSPPPEQDLSRATASPPSTSKRPLPDETSNPPPAKRPQPSSSPSFPPESPVSADTLQDHDAPKPSPDEHAIDPTSLPSFLPTDVSSLLANRKLCLVLDLDHTLLNSARFSEVEPEHEAALQARAAAEEALLPVHGRELYRLEKLGMWTKLRPGIRKFLETAAQHFELWIHTNGNKQYAAAMVELLDLDNEYFGPRVIAQGMTGQDAMAVMLTKRLMQGLEGREPVAIILDDSSAVWPHDRRNLLVVERYMYFPASRRKFGVEGRSLLEINRDECAEQGMLACCLSVLERLHAAVFRTLSSSSTPSAPPPQNQRPPSSETNSSDPAPHSSERENHTLAWDVRACMADERKLVLKGVHIVFSRVIPLEAEPSSHPLWQLAEQFGATCGTSVSERTTHVVAVMRGTEKTFWAAQHGKPVVTPAWLECSCIMWKVAQEDQFLVPY